MKLAHPELRSTLAAEYALGLMSGRARRRFEAMLAGDASLREELTFWHERLAEIPAQLTPVAPRERVWTALAREVLVDENKVRPLHAERRVPPAKPVTPPGLTLWRSWAVAASVASLVLAGALWREQQRSAGLELAMTALQDQPLPYVATIQFAGSEARWAVSLHPEKRLMRVHLVPGSMPIDITRRDLELWMLDAAGTPHSLGVLPKRAASAEMPLPEMPSEALRLMTLSLAVSEEPRGGSPTGLPTGKVLGAMPAARAL